MSPNPPMSDDLEEFALESHGLMTITLLKQYTYCPRIAYYLTCTPHVRPRTYKMLVGEAAHEQERKRAARRTLSAYQIEAGERHFDVELNSTTLGMVGIVDEVVLVEDQAIVVDYKLADSVGEHHQLQLTAYALLVEEMFNLPVQQGYIYLLKTKQFKLTPITPSFRNSVLEAASAVQHIQQYEYMPPPVEQRRKCDSCEFRRFCVDL